MDFQKYQHIERWGRDEVAGIEISACHVFPKIDGTNGSVWLGYDGLVKCGSRNREILLENDKIIDDNHGFAKYILHSEETEGIRRLIERNPNLRLFGEWLIPHTLKTYVFEAWKKFYVFDVCIPDGDRFSYMPYEQYQPLLDNYKIPYIPCIAIVTNPTLPALITIMENNIFLIQNGEGYGEGIIVKNYKYRNRYGNQTWAKIVANEFKAKHNREMGPPTIESKQAIETKISEELTREVAWKVLVNITHGEIDLFSSKDIPQLLGTVWHTFINEEMWHVLKKYKNPTIDFKLLQRYVIARTKKLTPEVF